MAKNFKFLLTVEDVNHRVFVDAEYITEDGVSFQDLQSVIRRSYEQFVPFLDKNNYTLEIFDKDFEEYVKLNENETIENKSKIRVKRVNALTTVQSNALQLNSSVSAIDEVEKFGCEEIVSESKNDDANNVEFKQLNINSNGFSQPQPAKRKSVKKLEENSDLSADVRETQKELQSSISLDEKDSDCGNSLLKVNPYFRKFSENNCNGEDHETNIPKSPTFEVHTFKSLSKPSESSLIQQKQSFNDSSSSRSSVQSPDDLILKINGKRKILKSNFMVKQFDEKLELMNVVKKLVSAKKSVDENNIEFWKKVSKSLQEKGIEMGYKKCKGTFTGLFSQYMSILKNLKEYTSQDAQNLWPFFELFHYSLNLTPFKSDISLLRAHFDQYEKMCTTRVCTMVNNNVRYPPNYTSITHCACFCQPNEPMNFPNDPDDTVDIDINSIERLMKAVSDNVKDLKQDRFTEDQFWQKIAYELCAYRDPIDEDSKNYWKIMFYTLLKRFLWDEQDSLLPLHVLSKLFDPLDISIFMNTNDSEMRTLLTSSQINSSGVFTDACEESATVNKTEDEILIFQRVFLTVIRKCLKFVAKCENDAEKYKKYWSKILHKMAKKGYKLDLNNLRAYLNEFIAVYCKTLETCNSFDEANERWPIFGVVHAIDLSPFISNCDYYRVLRNKFN